MPAYGDDHLFQMIYLVALSVEKLTQHLEMINQLSSMLFTALSMI